MDGIILQNSVSSPDTLDAAQQSRVDDREKAVDVAKKFEALLLFTMMKSMRSSLTEDTLTGSDQENTYREMMDREIAESIAKAGGLGLQSMLQNQLTTSMSETSEPSEKLHITNTGVSKKFNKLQSDLTAFTLDLQIQQRMLQTTLPD